IGTSLPLVLVRATLFVAQVLIMLYLAWMLMP
ncbi:MAG: MAPEG family protein, partial [Alcanivorax sp.]|nr:MAPEG family protein [Alcanivorax sp.]